MIVWLAENVEQICDKNLNSTRIILVEPKDEERGFLG